MEPELTQEDEARITDTTHKIQSAKEALSPIDPRKVPGLADIRACLQDADKTLRGVLRTFRLRDKKPQMGSS
jgi:hypothetical protein